MSLSEADIDRIVREVLRRLAAMSPPPAVATTSLSLKTRLVTMAELKGKLAGIKQVEVPPRAVVTPAARDYLRENKVQLVSRSRSCHNTAKPQAAENLMRIGEVIGTVTLSRAHPALAKGSLRLAVPLSRANLSRQSAERAEAIVVYDSLGAGNGSLIAISEGREAAQPFDPEMVPVDAYNAAILDNVTVEES